jgi:SAM-dependent methyltransferase
MRGIDTLIRKETFIPVDAYDGYRIPFADKSFDTVLFVDVVHHADNGAQLLREAVRVAKKSIVLKDHALKGILAKPTLAFMDWIGNAPHGVALPYNYWTEEHWRSEFENLRLTVAEWRTALGLYPPPFRWLFERQLHFIARLDIDSR